ncbi:MAG: hypothetical protein FJ368_02510 [Pelagibacterales bacterium]|nr:hypothetical protein [Pelagibacterales bacterium]
MKYPFTSFSLAFLVCFLGPYLLFCSFENKQKLIPATVEIDSVFIEESENAVNSISKTSAVKENSDNKVLQTESSQKQSNKNVDNKSSKKSEKNNHQQKNQESEKKLIVLYGPLPKIPEHLKSEAFHTYAMARFYVSKDGSAKVELIKPSSNPELSYLLLKNLANWKFESSEKESIQDIKVNFKVENQ